MLFVKIQQVILLYLLINKQFVSAVSIAIDAENVEVCDLERWMPSSNLHCL